MNPRDIELYGSARGEIAVRMGAPEANRLLLAMERLDQEGGLDPAFGDLRERLKTASGRKIIR